MWWLVAIHGPDVGSLGLPSRVDGMSITGGLERGRSLDGVVSCDGSPGVAVTMHARLGCPY
jgi:hypothetical protein